jgi:hypothetical protein
MSANNREKILTFSFLAFIRGHNRFWQVQAMIFLHKFSPDVNFKSYRPSEFRLKSIFLDF